MNTLPSREHDRQTRRHSPSHPQKIRQKAFQTRNNQVHEHRIFHTELRDLRLTPPRVPAQLEHSKPPAVPRRAEARGSPLTPPKQTRPNPHVVDTLPGAPKGSRHRGTLVAPIVLAGIVANYDEDPALRDNLEDSGVEIDVYNDGVIGCLDYIRDPQQQFGGLTLGAQWHLSRHNTETTSTRPPNRWEQQEIYSQQRHELLTRRSKIMKWASEVAEGIGAPLARHELDEMARTEAEFAEAKEALKVRSEQWRK